jgi:flagellar biosynthetic protein FliP
MEWRMTVEHGRSRAVGLAVLAAVFVAMAAATQPVLAQVRALRPAGLTGEGSEQVSPGQTAIDNPIHIPDLRKIAPTATDREGVASTVQILVILTVLALAPSILILTTCFTRIMVVLGMLRQALGTQQLPPGQVITGLSLFLTFMVMAPTWQKIHRDALTPYLDGKLSQRDAFDAALDPLREFMIHQIEAAKNEEGVYMLMEYREGKPWPAENALQWKDVPTAVLVPAYVLSELKAAFIMGFRFFLPFLVIDMVISTVLISMGMLMLPPVLISLPFKIVLFVLADGWNLVVGSLLTSFA